MIVGTVASPRLAAPAPTCLYPTRISASVREEQIAAWHVGEYGRSEIRVHLFEDAWLFPRGLVFTCRKELVPFTAALISEPEFHEASQHLESGGEARSDVGDDCLLCIRPGLTNYGHFVAEILPTIHLFNDAFPDSSATVLFGNVREHLRAIYLDAFGLIAAKGQRCRFIASFPVRVARLFVVEGLAVTHKYLSPLVNRAIDHLIERNSSGPGTTAPRLFLPRREATGRALSNGADVAAQVAGWEYATAYPEDWSFGEQIASFQHARRVIGVMGSALTNVLFAPAGARVIALAPESMFDTFFWRLCCLRRHRYLEVRCGEIPNDAASRTWHRNIDVPMDALRLAHVLAEAP